MTSDSALVVAGDDLGARVSSALSVGGLGVASTQTANAELSPEQFSQLWKTALLLADEARARSIQSDSGVLGASDALGCPHRAVLTVRRVPPSDVVEKGAAITGSALHESLLPAFASITGALIEQDLMLTLPSGGQIPVHPDICWADDNSITDLKTVKDLRYRQRVGPDDKHRAQVHLYALAALQNGLLRTEPAVRILYVSREDVLDTFVFQEPFSMDWVQRADDWFEAVRYAAVNDEDGQKDANPNFCRSSCGFVSICRPPLLDAAGEITNPGLVERIQIGKDARAQRKHFEKLEKDAVSELRGVSGTAGDIRIVSTTVNAATPYQKVEFFDV